MRGAGGHVGSIIRGTHAGNLIQWASGDYCQFIGMAFDGAGCTALKQTGSPTVDYLANLTVRDCHFYGQLFECIYGNLIYAKIERNSFGYFGTVGASHRHIYCLGIPTNTCNSNRITGNRFYYAKGAESCYFENGADLDIVGNNYEQNVCLPIRLIGMVGARVRENWFEANSGTTSEIYVASSVVVGGVIDLSGLDVVRNHFVHAGSVTRVVQVNTTNFDANGWAFDYNTGSAITITNDFSKLRDGTGAFTITDASGAGVAIGSSGTYYRVKNRVTLDFSISWPANANPSNAKIGGLPFVASGVAVARVLTDKAGGVDIATDNAASTMSVFGTGTLTALTNADLSGKQAYVSLSYLAA
jgi:hypothetical protein